MASPPKRGSLTIWWLGFKGECPKKKPAHSCITFSSTAPGNHTVSFLPLFINQEQVTKPAYIQGERNYIPPFDKKSVSL